MISNSTAFVKGIITSTCCESGYPEPGISKNGFVEQIVYGNHTDGIYRGCVSRVITTSGITAGARLSIYCNVSLSQRLTCTTTGTANSQVPQEVVSNCNATKVHQILLILQHSMLDQYETKYMPVCVTN